MDLWFIYYIYIFFQSCKGIYLKYFFVVWHQCCFQEFRLFSFFNITFYWLCYYNYPNYPPIAHLHPAPSHSLRQSPHPYSCPGVMHINSLATLFPMLYFTSPWLFCNYLLVLPNPLTSSPISLKPPPMWQPIKMLYIAMILSLFFFAWFVFLDSVFDRFLFFVQVDHL